MLVINNLISTVHASLVFYDKMVETVEDFLI